MAKETTQKKSKNKYVNTAVNNPNLKWYVLSTIAGHEKKVLQQLEQRVKANGLENKIAQVIVPTQDKVVAKEGKKHTREERFLPGYILIHVELDEDTWKIIRYTDGVTGFLGAGKEPEALSEKEVAAILALTEVQEASYKSSFAVGNPVKVVDGIFKDLIGTIQEIHEDKGQLTVLLSMFGREVPTKLDFLQVTNL